MSYLGSGMSLVLARIGFNWTGPQEEVFNDSNTPLRVSENGLKRRISEAVLRVHRLRQT